MDVPAAPPSLKRNATTQDPHKGGDGGSSGSGTGLAMPTATPTLVRNRTTQNPHGKEEKHQTPARGNASGAKSAPATAMRETKQSITPSPSPSKGQGSLFNGTVALGFAVLLLAYLFGGNSGSEDSGTPALSFDTRKFASSRFTEKLGHMLKHLPSTTSTMEDAKALMKGIDPSIAHGQVVLAEIQTKARGRKGRKWHASSPDNIYMSMVWIPSEAPNPPGKSSLADHLIQLNLAVSLSVANACRAEGINNVGVKWPNDVYISGKKAAGILIDYDGSSEGGGAIVGVGVNVNELLEESEPYTGVASAISLRDAKGFMVSRERVLAAILAKLEILMKLSLKEVLDQYKDMDILRGNSIRVHHKSKQVSDPRDYEATAIGVTREGLEVKKRNGEEITLSSEEVSITPL